MSYEHFIWEGLQKKPKKAFKKCCQKLLTAVVHSRDIYVNEEILFFEEGVLLAFDSLAFFKKRGFLQLVAKTPPVGAKPCGDMLYELVFYLAGGVEKKPRKALKKSCQRLLMAVVHSCDNECVHSVATTVSLFGILPTHGFPSPES